jgi:hypothetical protein
MLVLAAQTFLSFDLKLMTYHSANVLHLAKLYPNCNGDNFNSMSLNTTAEKTSLAVQNPPSLADFEPP